LCANIDEHITEMYHIVIKTMSAPKLNCV